MGFPPKIYAVQLSQVRIALIVIRIDLSGLSGLVGVADICITLSSLLPGPMCIQFKRTQCSAPKLYVDFSTLQVLWAIALIAILGKCKHSQSQAVGIPNPNWLRRLAA